MKILVVDFLKKFGNVLKIYLKDGGYNNVVISESVEESLKLLQLFEQQENIFDLIIMEFLKKDCYQNNLMKVINSAKNVPLIMVAEDTEIDTLQKIFDYGATDYISHPIKKIELLTRINSVFVLKNEMDTRKILQKEFSSLNYEMEHLSSIFEKMSKSDYLTGLPNRYYFEELISSIWGNARDKNVDFSFIKADIDFLKRYNSKYGFQAGDDTINTIANVINETVDIFDGVICRQSGGEFIIGLPDVDRYEAVDIAETIRQNVESLDIPVEEENVINKLTLSIGVTTTVPKNGNKELNGYIDVADEAMTKAKNGGSNRVVYLGHLKAV